MNHQRLEPLLDRARHHEDVVALDLAAIARDLSLQEQRLAELKSYAEEYAPPAEGVINPALLINRLAFRERIDDALERQTRAVENIRERCDVELSRLILARRETKVLGNLDANYRHEEARIERKKEQDQMDELAGRVVLLHRQSQGELQ